MKNTESNNRILAWVAVLATVLCVLLSVLFIRENLNHHCDGEDCPICQLMLQCEKQLDSMDCVVVVAAVSVFYALIQQVVDATDACVWANSLISRKVRLDI